MLAFRRYDFLTGFCERLSEITSLNKNRTARSFSAARAALLAALREKLSKLVGQVAHILEGWWERLGRHHYGLTFFHLLANHSVTSQRSDFLEAREDRR
jgi:hypothetical protein